MTTHCGTDVDATLNPSNVHVVVMATGRIGGAALQMVRNLDRVLATTIGTAIISQFARIEGIIRAVIPMHQIKAVLTRAKLGQGTLVQAVVTVRVDSHGVKAIISRMRLRLRGVWIVLIWPTESRHIWVTHHDGAGQGKSSTSGHLWIGELRGRRVCASGEALRERITDRHTIEIGTEI